MEENFFIKMVEQHSDTAMIELAGQLNTNAVNTANSIINSLPGNIQNIIFDCMNLTYISTPGLKLFLRTKKMYGEKQVKLININKYIMEILDVTGYDRLLLT